MSFLFNEYLPICNETTTGSYCKVGSFTMKFIPIRIAPDTRGLGGVRSVGVE